MQLKYIIITYNNDRCVFIYIFIYLYVRSANDTSESSQGIMHIYLDFIGPQKHLFSYYCTIFKLILFQYDASLSNNFCGFIDQCGSLILKQPSFMTARVHYTYYLIMKQKVTYETKRAEGVQIFAFLICH